MEDEDFLDNLNQQGEQEPAALPEPEKEAEAPVTEEAPKPETVEPAPVAEKPEPGVVPIGAMLDERDKRKRLEAELEEYRRANQKPVEAFQMPDMFEDPEGYTAALVQQNEQRIYGMRLQMSEGFARNRYGNEATEAALKWGYDRCNSDPAFNAQVQSSNDPVGFVVEHHKRDQIVSQVTPDDFEQFKAWKQAQQGLSAQPATQPQATQSTAMPPKSLATAPSAGNILSEVMPSDDEIFAETFARK